MEQAWTLEFLSVKTAGSRDILFLCIEFKIQNVSNAMAYTRVSITDILCGVANWTSRSVLFDIIFILRTTLVNYTVYS